ncbi:hypothetical protein ACUOFX_26015, partial [Escherichia coli]
EVDVKRQRIALTMRLSDEPGQRIAREGGSPNSNASAGSRPASNQRSGGRPANGGASAPSQGNSAMAAAFAKLKR